jgi:hypothetical protein
MVYYGNKSYILEFIRKVRINEWSNHEEVESGLKLNYGYENNNGCLMEYENLKKREDLKFEKGNYEGSDNVVVYNKVLMNYDNFQQVEEYLHSNIIYLCTLQGYF